MGDGIIGRRRELDALRAWFDAVCDGSGRLILCVGEPGIGKTRLAHELARAAVLGGIPVAWRCGVEAEGAPAFGRDARCSARSEWPPDRVLTAHTESPKTGSGCWKT